MNVIVIGAGAHAKVVSEIISFNKKVKMLGFTDHNPKLRKQKIFGYRVLGSDKIILVSNNHKKLQLVIGIGDSDMPQRAKLFQRFQKLGFHFISVIHPSAIISPQASIGKGVVVCAGAIINTATKIHDNVVINTGAIVEHDNQIGNNVYLSPGTITSGNVNIGDNVFIGSGAVILPGISIGQNSLIGAGSVVTKNLPERIIAYGVPARVVRNNNIW